MDVTSRATSRVRFPAETVENAAVGRLVFGVDIAHHDAEVDAPGGRARVGVYIGIT